MQALNFAPQTRVPPQAIESEAAIIGSILIDPNAFVRVDAILNKDMFYVEAHGLIYEAAAVLNRSGQPIDQMSVVSLLRDHNRLDKVGGEAQVASLANAAISSANVDQYATLVKDRAIRRQIVAAGKDVQQLAYQSQTPLAEVIDKSEIQVFRITQSLGSQQGLTPNSDIIVDAFSEIEGNSLKEKLFVGVPSGFDDLDDITGGFQRGDLIIPAARPAMGKTAMFLQVARNVAATLPVAVFSLEMSKQQLVYRLLASESGIPAVRLRSGRIGAHEWERLQQAIEQISALQLHIDDTPGISPWEIRQKCRRMMAKTGQLGLIVIDYLQLMWSDEKSNNSQSDNRTQQLSQITRSLKGLARELNVPVIALSQLSRAVESRTNKRPIMADLRDSGSIEQDGDLIIFLYREDYYEPDTRHRGVTEVIVSKQRNGRLGTAKLLFEPQFTRFRRLRDDAA